VPARASYVNSALYGVACATATACFAVGVFQEPTYRTHPLVEGWDGRAWRVFPSQDVPGQGDLLTAVSCSSAVYCVAVGSASGPVGNTLPMSEVWNGRTWALTPRQPVSATTGGETSPLGVSCEAVAACVLVGEVSSSGHERPVVQAWNGAAWATQTVLGPNRSFSYLDGVSCASLNACSAVGSNGNGALGVGYGA
jgi:hypothetical protein